MAGTTHYMQYEEIGREFRKVYLFPEEFDQIRKIKDTNPRGEIFFKRMGRNFIVNKIKEYGELKESHGGGMINGILLSLLLNEYPIALQLIKESGESRTTSKDKRSVWFKNMKDHRDFMRKAETRRYDNWCDQNPRKAETWNKKMNKVLENKGKNQSILDIVRSVF